MTREYKVNDAIENSAPVAGAIRKQDFQDALELGEAKKIEAEQRSRKPDFFQSVRFYVMFVALLSPIVSTYSKNAINFTIIRMIDPNYLAVKHGPQLNTNTSDEGKPYFELDNSCPILDESVRERLLRDLDKASLTMQTTKGEKFPWDEAKQGYLKSAYSVGHIFAIQGSRWSEIYDAHRVLTASILVTAICSLLVPFLAQIHFILLLLDLFIMGVVGSFVTPSLITFFSNWLTAGEKSLMLTFYLITSRLGSALTAAICGSLLNMDLSWRYVYFIGAFANFLFVVLFFLFGSSTPSKHFLVSKLELDYLASKNILVRENLHGINDKGNPAIELEQTTIQAPASEKKPKSNPPWGAILTSVPVWSFVVAKFCVKMSGDLAGIELPAYLDRVMHYDPGVNGLINGNNYIIFCAGSFIAGALAKIAVKRRPFNLSKTAIRKIFQSISSFGSAFAILGMALSICHGPPTITFLLIWFFITTFGTGGEQQIPMDITDRYAGTIHAIGSTLSVSGIIIPNLIGFYLKGHASDVDRWQNIWFAASAISFFGGLVFVLGADANVQSFDSISGDEGDQEKANGAKRSDGNAGSDNKAFEGDHKEKEERESPVAAIAKIDITSKQFKESKVI